MVIESKIAVNCHRSISLQQCNKNKFIFGKIHCFSRKMFRRCLTFDAVYRHVRCVIIYFNTLKNTDQAPGLQCFLNFKVDLNLRFSLKMTKVYYNHFPKDKVDLNLQKYLNI